MVTSEVWSGTSVPDSPSTPKTAGGKTTVEHPPVYHWKRNLHMKISYRDFLVAQMVKNLPAMWETWVQSLDREDSLGEGMATHSSILA